MSFTVGSFCSLAENIKIFLGGFGDHPIDFPSTYPVQMLFPDRKANMQRRKKRKPNISIGHDVWIGRDVTVLQGIVIGSGSVVGASAVVTTDIPPYAIVAGVPGKVVGYRFAPEIIERLLRLRWWDFPDSEIEKNLDLFTQPDIERFLESMEAAKISARSSIP